MRVCVRISGAFLLAGLGMVAWLAAEPCAAAQAKKAVAEHVEVGTLDHASFRIDIPTQWNGTLIVYYHGYSETPVTYVSRGWP